MPNLQAPLAGWSVTVNRSTYTTNSAGQIAVTRQSDIDALRARGWRVVSPPTPPPTPIPTPTRRILLDSAIVRMDSGTIRMSAT